MTGKADPARKEVFFRGEVQGVGFRYATCRVAERFNVSGTVENLRDGRVLLVVEGDRREVDRFIKAVEERMNHYITGVEANESTASHQFQAFSVRY